MRPMGIHTMCSSTVVNVGEIYGVQLVQVPDVSPVVQQGLYVVHGRVAAWIYTGIRYLHDGIVGVLFRHDV
jgi:hypothetical protein